MRKSKLTKDIQNKIVQAIQSGATYELSAQYAGIATSTFYLWLKHGREQKGKKHIEFLEAIKRAESMGAIANLGLIQKAAKDGDWKASAWILERRHGFSKDGALMKNQYENEEPENAETFSTKKILQSQLSTTIKASKDALQSGSYQAFAALQRQVVHVALQLKAIDAEGQSGEFDEQSDEDILTSISNIILSLPPILQQRLSNDMIGLLNNDVKAEVTE